MTYQMRKNEGSVVDVIVEAFENLRPLSYSMEAGAVADVIDCLADALGRSIGPRFHRDEFVAACIKGLNQ